MYSKFNALLEQKNVSAYKVAKDLGFSSGMFSNWKAGRATPKQDKIQKIADYFNVPISYFYGEQPVYDVAAGEGRINDVSPTETISDITFTDNDEEYSYIRICGDSMLPEIRNGDIVKVHHQPETNKNDYTVVKVDGETATIKHVEFAENGVWLRATNKDVYKDRFFSIQEVMTLPVTIIGKAVEIRRAL